MKNTWNFCRGEIGTFLMIRGKIVLDREGGTAVSPTLGNFG